MEPVLDQLAAEFDGRIQFAKVDVDNDPQLAEQYGVRAVPTLILFQDARVLRQVIGLASRGWLEAVLEKAGVVPELQTEALAVG